MAAKEKTILVVDDAPEDIAVLEAILKEDYRVKAATSGEAALKIARTDPPPDLILLDVLMPGMDGFDVCRTLQQDIGGASIPVIFLSVRGEPADESAGFELGAVDYIVKPVDPYIVKTRVKAHLERKDEALRASEIRYRRLFEAARDGILILDAETGMVVDVNPFLVEMLGFSRAAFLGKRIWELGFLRDVAGSRDKFLELQRKGYVRYEDLPLQTADGRRIDVEFVSNVYTVNRRDVIQCNIRDITDRTRAEEERRVALARQEGVSALQQSLLAPAPLEQKLKSMTDGIVRLFDADFCRIWLIRPGDLCEQGCIHASVTEGPHVCRYRDRCLHLLASSGRYTHTDGTAHRRVPFGCYKIGRVASGEEHKFVTNDVQNDPRVHDHAWARELGLVSFAGYQLRAPGGDTLGVLALFCRFPITSALDAVLDGLSSTVALVVQHDAADRALRESEARYRTLFEASADGILIADTQTMSFRYANPALCRMLGYSEEELRAMGVADIHPRGAVDRVVAEFEAHARRDKTTAADIPCVRKDGSVAYADVSSVAMTIDGAACIVGLFHDVTERKRAELEREKLEAQLRQAQKMEAVGRLAGGVAHDFNNMLQVINSYAEVLLTKLDPSDPLRAHVHQIARAGQRSADLTHQLLAFARKQAIAPKILDLNDTVAGMLKMLSRLIGEDIDLLWRPVASPWLVRVDPSQIDQILANLAVNARDAISGIGKVTIETDNVELDRAYCESHVGSVPGQYVLLAVSDDGCGMDKETQARLFEPFFTTKPSGQGTGLGLATVYGIVKQNNGLINVYSEPGKGTTFKIYLPRQESDTPASDEEHEDAAVPTGSETVLLVEDEAALLELARMLLEDLGYAVLAAGSPLEAIRLVGGYAGAIDLLLTDVVMPEMTGRDLWRRLGELRPGLKCLFMSGYTADAIIHRGILDEGIHFLQKPFSTEKLAVKLREALSA